MSESSNQIYKSELLAQFNDYFITLFRRITEPHPTITNAQTRHQIRFQAFWLISAIPLSLIIATLLAWLGPNPTFWLSPDYYVIFIVMFIFALGYKMSRGRYYIIAAYLIIIVPAIAIFTATVISTDPLKINFLFYLTSLVLFSSLLLPIRFTLLFVILNLMGMFILPWFDPNLSLSDLMFAPIIFMVATSSLAIGIALYQRFQKNQLLASEKRLQMALDAGEMVAWRWGFEAGNFEWSSKMEGLYGFKPGTFDGKMETLINRIYPEERQLVERIIKATTNQESYDITYRVIWPDQTIRWMRTKGSVITNDNARKLYTTGVTHDITHQKQTQSDLESAKKEAELTNKELQNQVIKRQRAETALQYRLVLDHLMTTLSNRFINATPDTIDDELRDALKKIGEFIGVDRSYLFLFSRDGKSVTTTYYWCAPNIKPHPAAFKEILFQENLLVATQIMQLKLVSIPRLDKITEPERTVLKTADIASTLMFPLVHRSNLIGIVGLDCVQRPRSWSEDATTLLKIAGETFTNALMYRTLQNQLYQTQKMEAVGRLAGGVAHDFNNLLTVITGYCELILSKMDKDNPIRPDLETIEESGQRAAALTGQLLAFSRKQPMLSKATNLNTLITGMEKMLQRLIGEKIALQTQLNPKLEQVKIDSSHMEQVIMNLAVNARDAMPGGGDLTIGTDNVYLDETYAERHLNVSAGPYILLKVQDTGIGMDNETQANIFDPFFTTKPEGEGTGLGLSTVYGIVVQSGGHIVVNSKLNQGTAFKIYLPLVYEEEAPVIEKKSVVTQRGVETILLVEDEDEVRRLGKSVLEENGYKVLEAANGKEAFDICQSYQGVIHLMVTDVVMPGELDGGQLGQKVVALRPNIKIIYMSGYTDSVILKHGVFSSKTPFIGKPFTPSKLIGKVRQTLDDNHQ